MTKDNPIDHPLDAYQTAVDVLAALLRDPAAGLAQRAAAHRDVARLGEALWLMTGHGAAA